MFLLLPIAWLLLWIGLGVIISAALGIPPDIAAVESSALIFLGGGIVLPAVSFAVYHIIRKRCAPPE